MKNDRTWGVTPVPDRLRTLSLGDLTLLWGNLGISLLVLVAGTYLAGLGLQRGLLAIVVGAALGCALLGFAGYIGADRRLPGMVLMRQPLGQRGSYAPTVLNVVQNLGWATFELIVIAAAANALADRVFGFRERWVWVLVFGAITLALALAGPIAFVRKYVRRFAVWAVAASVGYLTWWALDGASTGDLWNAGAASWLPLAADYTRFARRPRHAFWGTAVGYFIPLVWLYGLGALLFLSRGTSDTTALLTSVAAGGIASALALVALTVDETDEPFANVYSAAVSMQNLVPEAPQRLLVLGIGGLAICGALIVDLGRYQSFLFMLGSVFVPLFGVLAADFLYGPREPVRIRWSGIAAWLAGVALYQWIQPTGPAWWVDAVGRVPGAGDFTGGASLPSFALAFALVAGLRYVHAPTRRRRARLAGSR
jgi:NCS1 family nucleobase:cation symporter-1